MSEGAGIVLVTGGAGFIGSHLCEVLLAQGREVVAVDDLSSGHLANLVEARATPDRFRFYKVDVLAAGLPDLIAKHAPEVVVHLAADGSARARWDPEREARLGVGGLLWLLDGSSRHGVRKVVVGLPAAVYGNLARLPATERALAAARPGTPAGISGLAALDYLGFFRRSRDLDFTALVMPTVYGPRQDGGGEHGVVAMMAARMLEGRSVTVRGDGTQTRDLLFVDDAVHGLSLAIGGGSGRVVNLGTGVETKVTDLVRKLRRLTGWSGQVEREELRPGEARRVALDAREAERRLGWRPWTHLEDGLRETVAALRTG